jgi:hypothetical protein
VSTSIGKILTEVVPSPEPEAPAAGASPGAELARLRRELARAERQAERLRAEDFDD